MSPPPRRGLEAARWAAAAVIATALLSLLGAGSARAADRVYWGAFGEFGFADLGDPGGGLLATGSTPVDIPEGVAIDTATERVYWADRIGNELVYTIRFAKLDGSGGGELNTTGATVREVSGLAIDPVGRRAYWANRSAGTISFANLDGSGGGDLPLALPRGAFPAGVAVDPVARRLYWINSGGLLANKLFSANLDGSGEESVNTAGAEVAEPAGLAIDPGGGRAYWANLRGGISYASLDGSGGGRLDTSGAFLRTPWGVAIDPVARRVYWANRIGSESTVSFASLDGGHGGDIPTKNSGGGGGTEGTPSPAFPVLLVAPRAIAPPRIGGASAPGATLSCSRGEWAGDVAQAFYYRAPSSFEYQWARDGVDVPGATRSTLAAGPGGGDYRCRVTASDPAGATTQVSGPFHVSAPGFAGPARITLALARAAISPRGPVPVRVTNGNGFGVRGTISASSARGSGRRAVKLGAKAFSVGARAHATVRLSLPRPLRSLLARRRRVPLLLSATVTDPAASRRTVTRRVVARLRAGRRRAARR